MNQPSRTSDGRNQSICTIVDNNLFLIKYMCRQTPIFIFIACFYPSFQAFVVYFERTLGIKFITDAIQYNEPFSKVVYYMIFICTLILVSLLLNKVYWHVLLPKGMEKLNFKIKSDLYDKASRIDLACYDDPNYYNEFVLSIQEVQNRVSKMIDFLYNVWGNVAYVVVITGFFLITDIIGLIFAAVSLISTLLNNLALNKWRYKMRLELNAKERKRSYINRVFYLADFAKELRLYDVNRKLRNEFKQSNFEIRQIIQQYSKRMFFLNFVENVIYSKFILDCLYLLYIAFMTLVNNAFSYGSAVALANSNWRLKKNLQALNKNLSEMQENSLYIAKIRNFINYKEQIVDKDVTISVPVEPGTIELKNVSFAYNGEVGPVLKRISLIIRPYEKIAFVGYNGSGKTTLMKLLMRLYDVTDGQILINGKDIREYKLSEYRASFRSVFQDYQLFATTLAENVVMDRVSDSAVIRSNVETALNRSGFRDQLARMANGLDTPMTREFEENGTNLSGGEAQKVAIARIFAKPCPYVILDEPSSAIDPISEYQLIQSIISSAANSTVLFISHRLSTTRMADRIYMLENGEIIEHGTHAELMQLNGKYAEMFTLQAKKYRVLSGTAD